MPPLKHRTIPIFVPEVSCPNQCIYCNQRVISGQQHMPTDKEITATIERYSSTFEAGMHVELAFFGGNFTGIPMSEQQRLFDLVRPYCQRIGVQGIRLSTRPDYISDDKVDFLKDNGVTTVELGVQSLDDEVLARIRRGYTAETVERAAEIIQKHDIEVGMQMMLGLPGDTAEKALRTARRIIELGATNTRISAYPARGCKSVQRYTLSLRNQQYNGAARGPAPHRRFHQPHRLPCRTFPRGFQGVGADRDMARHFQQSHVAHRRFGNNGARKSAQRRRGAWWKKQKRLAAAVSKRKIPHLAQP